VEGAGDVAVPRAQRVGGGGLDVRDEGAERVGGERALHEAAQAEVVAALVEEERLGPDEPLLAGRVRRLEQVRLRHQHEVSRVGAPQHHARAAQQVRLEDVAVPAQTVRSLPADQ
jgi:hypothetical protein